MNPQKLDGPLLGQLAAPDAGRGRHAVLVRTKARLPAAGQALLRECGAREDPARATVFALELSPAQVERLSDEDWVLTIRSSRQLRPLA